MLTLNNKRDIKCLIRKFWDRAKDTKAVLCGNRLPLFKSYEYGGIISQELIEKEPQRWIIPECLEACKILWSKNIYTYQSSSCYSDDSWIEIKLSNLSLENQMIMHSINDKLDKDCYTFSYREGCRTLFVRGKGEKAKQKLIQLANMFVMQDVPDYEARTTIEKLREEYNNPILGGCLEQLYTPLTDEEIINRAGVVSLDGEENVYYTSAFHLEKHLNYKK